MALYEETSEYNGKYIYERQRRLFVTEGKNIIDYHLFPNKDIIAILTLKGKRGSTYLGYLHKNKKVSLFYRSNATGVLNG